MGEQERAEPRRLRRAPLTGRERRRAAGAAVAPVIAALVVLVPVALASDASAGEVVVAALVYGGLLGLAAGFVYVDRAHARQCPRCTTRNGRNADWCAECGYDLEKGPRYACEQRHLVYVERGLCRCGRRLQELPVARGIGRELKLMLKVGAWLLAFLLGVGILLNWISV